MEIVFTVKLKAHLLSFYILGLLTFYLASQGKEGLADAFAH